MRYISFTVGSEEGWRVDAILQKKLFFGTARINSLKRTDGGILLGGMPVHTDVRVKKGDVVSARIDDPEGHNPAPPVDIPLRFLYEDEDLVVLDKQAGLATQGPPEIGTRTIAGAIAFLWGNDKDFHPVSRLDRGTSGLMLIAKNGYVHDRLRRMLHSDELLRKYLAVVDGKPHPPAADIEFPIARENDLSLKRTISEGGKPSKTHYKVLRPSEKYSLLEATPYTGRTHQIRVHLSAIGHPIVGDWLYGSERKDLIERPALHSWFLSFQHPILNTRLTFTSSMPEDMRSLLDK